MEQNYKNHTRYEPLYHIVLGALVIVLVVMGITHFVNFIRNTDANRSWFEPTFFLLSSLAIALVTYFARTFPLKAQDRAVRAEENLRYFSLTGKLFPKEITLGQIIALRFASDEELIALTQAAITEKLTKAQIKERVKNWRADNNRI